ncbi:chromate transporter [Filomicrobium insigne]|uniref:Chromate transporter n=1 Tax=Filomicrobium insigne TaxID=418854 RepID=A0A1H0IQ67_9HYPH|nr:chromate efflux transporter [Filomicrobium insigne]SDO33546.1 chromate transporter [Filomicrobium insigne]
MTLATEGAEDSKRRSSVWVIFLIFTRLGLTSFGGPIAHLGYFREEFIARRRWMSEAEYADMVALAQFLPGPASSQVGFAIGVLRGGFLGGLAAWAGFTLPSVFLLIAFAYGTAGFDSPLAASVLHGLKIVAVAVVAQAVWGMTRSLCPDRERATIAVLAVLIIAFVGGSLGQISAIVLGGLIGLLIANRLPDATSATSAASSHTHLAMPLSRGAGAALLLTAIALLGALPLLHHLNIGGQEIALFDAFYRAGALVFGGGHVVLPLLQDSVVDAGWVTPDAFMAGYGATQAVPGPLFTFAAYLGFVSGPEPHGWSGAAIALAAVFLPGLLLMMGALPYWDTLRRFKSARAAMAGINAAVVGVLGAALYDPVWTSAILNLKDFTLAVIAFVLLMAWKAPAWMVVVGTALGAVVFAQIP